MVELALGALLLVVTFTGSFVVGLRASAPIEQIRRRQAEFTADASHELRTPLSVIQAEVDLALSHDRDPASYRATLERVSAEGWRLRSIVDDLLWLARHDGDAPSPNSDAVADVRAVARDCAVRFEAIALAADVDLVHPREEGPAPVVADPDAIDRLVSVLVDNACRYAGTERDASRSRWPRSAGRVTLTVDDSGPGIPPEQRELVLDRFHRADDPARGHRTRAGHRRFGGPVKMEAPCCRRPLAPRWGTPGGDVASRPRAERRPGRGRAGVRGDRPPPWCRRPDRPGPRRPLTASTTESGRRTGTLLPIFLGRHAALHAASCGLQEAVRTIDPMVSPSHPHGRSSRPSSGLADP